LDILQQTFSCAQIVHINGSLESSEQIQTVMNIRCDSKSDIYPSRAIQTVNSSIYTFDFKLTEQSCGMVVNITESEEVVIYAFFQKNVVPLAIGGGCALIIIIPFVAYVWVMRLRKLDRQKSQRVRYTDVLLLS
jgi:hypothetical protein